MQAQRLDDDDARRDVHEVLIYATGLVYPRVPRPITAVLCADEYAQVVPLPLWTVRGHVRFAQARVYAHLPVGNTPRWFECSICAEYRFAPLEEAAQHSSKHPSVCVRCLRKMFRCPFCRAWIGDTNIRRLCVRLLAPSVTSVQRIGRLQRLRDELRAIVT